MHGEERAHRRLGLIERVGGVAGDGHGCRGEQVSQHDAEPLADAVGARLIGGDILERAVRGGLAAAQIGIVDDVVMHQGCGLEHLDRTCHVDDGLADRAVAIGVRLLLRCIVGREGEQGSQPLASLAGSQGLACHGVHDGGAGAGNGGVRWVRSVFGYQLLDAWFEDYGVCSEFHTYEIIHTGRCRMWAAPRLRRRRAEMGFRGARSATCRGSPRRRGPLWHSGCHGACAGRAGIGKGRPADAVGAGRGWRW